MVKTPVEWGQNAVGRLPRSTHVRTVLAAAILCALGSMTGCQTAGGGTTRTQENAAAPADALTPAEPNEPLLVTTATDHGPGSLRQALLESNSKPGPDVIRFDTSTGVFGPPRTISLTSELPEIIDDVTIDGYLEGFLWRSAGVILSGANKHRILTVAPGVQASVRNLTLADGRADRGGAVLNRGRLVLSGVTAKGNEATRDGGAIANLKGDLHIVNSTFADNRARGKGGAVSSRRGTVTVTNSTFSDNAARKGGALYSSGALLLRNSILANSDAESDCVLSGVGVAGSTHNIVERNANCPGVLHEADPALGRLDYFNGMTQTFSLGMQSLALNSGHNAAALDENGNPLVWDQRGNGDPRFVAGYTDIGAFETQAFPKLVVDTLDEGPLQGCGGGPGDCPLRAALRLADVSGKPEVITFDTRVFRDTRSLLLERPLPVPSSQVTLDASALGGLSIATTDGRPVFEHAAPSTIILIDVELIHPAH